MAENGYDNKGRKVGVHIILEIYQAGQLYSLLLAALILLEKRCRRKCLNILLSNSLNDSIGRLYYIIADKVAIIKKKCQFEA